MPAPLAAAAAVPLVTKAGAALAKLGALFGKKAAVTQLAIPGLQPAAAVAATGIKGKLGALGTRIMSSGAVPRTMGQAVDRFAIDGLMGAAYGAMTPGDLGDKLIAGTTSAVGGAVGGMALRGAWSPTSTLGIQLAEVGGSVGGDMMANGISDGLLRMKGGGTTPYEKMAIEQQRQLEQQVFAQYMQGKGGYPPTSDPFLAGTGLG
jgi:hypothetical protein